MFNFFKRKPKPMPPFLNLEGYANRDKYFYRLAEWYWHKQNEIVVIDPHHPRVITLDPWPQAVYLEADGQKTVSQLVYFIADKYTGDIPERLDEVIINQLESLLKEQIIKLSDSPQTLESNILKPKKN